MKIHGKGQKFRMCGEIKKACKIIERAARENLVDLVLKAVR
jgi:hypothetical protein